MPRAKEQNTAAMKASRALREHHKQLLRLRNERKARLVAGNEKTVAVMTPYGPGILDIPKACKGSFSVTTSYGYMLVRDALTLNTVVRTKYGEGTLLKESSKGVWKVQLKSLVGYVSVSNIFFVKTVVPSANAGTSNKTKGCEAGKVKGNVEKHNNKKAANKRSSARRRSVLATDSFPGYNNVTMRKNNAFSFSRKYVGYGYANHIMGMTDHRSVQGVLHVSKDKPTAKPVYVWATVKMSEKKSAPAWVLVGCFVVVVKGKKSLKLLLSRSKLETKDPLSGADYEHKELFQSGKLILLGENVSKREAAIMRKLVYQPYIENLLCLEKAFNKSETQNENEKGERVITTDASSESEADDKDVDDDIQSLVDDTTKRKGTSNNRRTTRASKRTKLGNVPANLGVTNAAKRKSSTTGKIVPKRKKISPPIAAVANDVEKSDNKGQVSSTGEDVECNGMQQTTSASKKGIESILQAYLKQNPDIVSKLLLTPKDTTTGKVADNTEHPAIFDKQSVDTTIEANRTESHDTIRRHCIKSHRNRVCIVRVNGKKCGLCIGCHRTHEIEHDYVDSFMLDRTRNVTNKMARKSLELQVERQERELELEKQNRNRDRYTDQLTADDMQ